MKQDKPKKTDVEIINLSGYELLTSVKMIEKTLIITIADNDTRLKVPRESMIYIKNNLPNRLIGAEIGTDEGSHALQIVHFLDCKLYAIDKWEDYYETNSLIKAPELSKNSSAKNTAIVRLKNYNAKIIQGDSVKVAKTFKDGFFDFVYIDANHTYENVKQDIIAWKPKVKKGGVLCGHDYCNECEGVKKAVDELLPNIMSVDNTRYPDWFIRLEDK